MSIYISGTRIADRYEVVGAPLLGGMGVVYLCYDHQEQRPVALKTFRPELLPDRAARGRFLQEGETWVRLGKHPHIVRCFQVFQDSPRPEVYLVLELIAREQGRKDASLRSWLTPGRPLPVDQALLIALQIVRGMRHATDTIPGFVHRDLKPENVLVGADRLSNAPLNRVRITDFGLVKGLRAEQMVSLAAPDLAARPGRLTQMGAVVGTPHYMAPEQWSGTDVTVTVQADIYALGCILGEILTGRMLVQGQTLDELRHAHQAGQALQAVQMVTATPQEVLAGCLAVSPTQRYQDWAALDTTLTAAFGRVAGRPVPEAEASGVLSQAERIAAGWSYGVMGDALMDIGNAAASVAYLVRALEIGVMEKEERLQIASLNDLGRTALKTGNPHQAIAYFRRSIDINSGIGKKATERSLIWDANQQLRADAFGGLGIALDDLGDPSRSVISYQHALTIYEEIGDLKGMQDVLGNLGSVYNNLGDISRAIGLINRALDLARQLGDRRAEGHNLGNLGVALRSRGDIEKAIFNFRKALDIAREFGDRQAEGDALDNLGICCADLGDSPQAIDYYLQALTIHREVHDRQGEGKDLSNLGSFYLALGKAQVAIEYFVQALRIAQEIGDRRGEGHRLGNLGAAFSAIGRMNEAVAYFEEGLNVHRETSDLSGVATCSFNLSLMYARSGQTSKALPLARKAAEIWGRSGPQARAESAEGLVRLLSG